MKRPYCVAVGDTRLADGAEPVGRGGVRLPRARLSSAPVGCAS
jgi:hypothetical protein